MPTETDRRGAISNNTLPRHNNPAISLADLLGDLKRLLDSQIPKYFFIKQSYIDCGENGQIVFPGEENGSNIS
jgi:hypothetical protein